MMSLSNKHKYRNDTKNVYELNINRVIHNLVATNMSHLHHLYKNPRLYNYAILFAHK